MEIYDEEKFEEEVVEKLTEKGWVFIPSNELNREDHEEPLLLNKLRESISRINSKADLDDYEITKAITELKLKSSGFGGVKQVLYALKHGVTIKSRRGRDLKPVRLFDFQNLDNNEYLVSRQVIYRGKEEIKTDVVLYVNGIPIVNIELKNPAIFSETWLDAYNQIKRYEVKVPELYKYVQIGVAAEAKARYFPIVPWLDDVRTYEWKDDSVDPIDSILNMLSKDRILDIIRNYIFIREEAGLEKKVITRYMQYKASEKIVNRVLGHLDGKEDKNHGLIWHWQGSGKTLTMIFAANKLYQLNELENPSIFFIVDRRDLRDQLYQEFTALDAIQPELINSIDDLVAMIRHDEFKGKKGVFITLVQKFRPEKLDQLRVELQKLSKKGWSNMSTRQNVVAFVDEAHRTQDGTLAGQMRDILKSGFFFGFTGTPILKKDRNTYSNFAYPPEEYYLDRYFITDSINDGFTVKIVYQPRLGEDINLDKKMLKIFADLQFEEIPEKFRDDVEKGVKDKLNGINLFLENEVRIRLVARDIAKHFEENVNGKFKAMIVAPSRKACVHYKRALDEYLHHEYSEVVMSYDKKDDQLIKDFEVELRLNHNGKDPEEIKKEVVEKFKDKNEQLRILIVTDMLLTGFDAPILQTMYLDKPLKEHRLLQAVARTNRPYQNVKEAGYIIDYVGVIKDEIQRAFQLYAEDEFEGALYQMPEIRTQFNSLMDETLLLFENVNREKFDRESILQAFEILTTDDEKAEKFVNNYRTLSRLFEFLGPDYIKLDRLEDYKWLSAVYVYYRKMVSSNPALDKMVRKYYDKTIKFVHRTSEFEKFEDNLPIIEFDEHYLENLEKIDNEEEKAANIVFTLNKMVLVDRHKNPVYESVVDKVERVLQSWKAKTKEYKKIYLEGIEIVKEIENRSERQIKLGFTEVEYSLFLVLEEKLGKDASLIGDVKELFEILNADTFEGWKDQRSVRKRIERDLQKFLRKHYYKKFKMDRKSLEDLRKDLMNKVEDYGA